MKVGVTKCLCSPFQTAPSLFLYVTTLCTVFHPLNCTEKPVNFLNTKQRSCSGHFVVSISFNTARHNKYVWYCALHVREFRLYGVTTAEFVLQCCFLIHFNCD